jgi:hypothetical protein
LLIVVSASAAKGSNADRGPLLPCHRSCPTNIPRPARTLPSALPTKLYTTAAITTGSGTVFAWTFLRYINGALSIRTEKLAGPGTTGNHVAMTYSRNERRSKRTEEKYDTRELLGLWERYNRYRAIILCVGTLVGAWGLLSDR